MSYSVSSKDPTTGLYKKDFESKQELVQKDPTDIEHVRDIENDDKNLCSIHAFYICWPFFFLPTFLYFILWKTIFVSFFFSFDLQDFKF